MIKHLLVVSLGLTAGLAMLAADELPDLSEFMPLQANSGPVFYEDFNKGLEGWRDLSPGHFTFCAHDGLMGTGCLMAERKAEDPRIELQREVKLKHGVLYRLRVRYRSEMVPEPGKPEQEIFCIRFRNEKTGEFDRGSFNKKRSDENHPEWTEWVHSFRVPEGYDSKVVLGLLICHKRTGKVWFEDISIEGEADSCALFPVKSNIMTYAPKEGITWFISMPANFSKSDYKVLAEAGGRKKLLEVEGNYAHGFFGDFPEGSLPIKASLLDMNNKTILASDESVLFVRHVENIPGRIVMGDGGRMIRDGKPYLPVGVFLGWHEARDTQILRRIKDAGFNSVEMVWRWIDFAGPRSTVTETMLAGIREMAKHDLSLLCAIKYQIPCSPSKTEEIDGIKGLDEVTRHIICAVRHEPNLIAYYISDENPVTEIPSIRRLRETAAKLDPWHPSMTLTCRADDLSVFAGTGDYLMFDSYPVGVGLDNMSPRQSMKETHLGMKKAKRTGVPFVWVPQIFCWNSSNSSWCKRYPTAKEIRSMALLGAVYEARAYFFYSYHHIFYLGEKNDPGHSEEAWKNAVVGAKLISSLAPWFLSTEPAPEAQIKQISGAEVAARAFVHEGKPLVVITADGPDECEAEITIPGFTGLKSRYGNTQEVAPGVYRFKGLNIDSDVLEKTEEK
ncbi:MAG: hypothetical protein J5944_01005 [Lentisphaeria bacterium]|nr:hypothetical protein [Lentisphaeria bacterium]